MRRHDPAPGTGGFSLVEMLVALVFTSLLMAGMAAVFKGSLSGYVTTAEKLASLRQGQLATDILADDLTYAGSTPTSLLWPPPQVVSTNPAFFITPNVSYPSTNDPVHLGDQLFLYYDRILPYPCTLATAVPSSAQMVAGATPATTVTLTFNDTNQSADASTEVSNAITAGMPVSLFLQSNATPLPAASLSAAGVVTLGSAPPPKNAGTIGSTANLIIPGQYIRYSIQPLRLDPASSSYTPCLVRDLIAYPGSVAASWASPITTTIIADDITSFRVGLSADGGATWAGIDPATGTWSKTSSSFTDITGPDTNPLTPTLNYQLATLNTGLSPIPTVNNGGTFWFRTFPVLVRLDITTRTATQRSEYSANGKTAAYRYQTRTLIINPRHFGLGY